MSWASSSATTRLNRSVSLRQRQALERAVGGVQDRRRRRLVDLAALDADEAVLDVVDPADAVRAAERVQPLDQLDRPAAARRRARPGCRPRTRSTISTGVGRVGRRDRPLVDVGGRRDPRVLEDAGLERAAPEVDVDRVGRGLRDRDLDAALDRVVDLLVAGQAHPDAHRGDDLEPRVEGVDRDVEADLVVALAGAAVGDRVGALALRRPRRAAGRSAAGRARSRAGRRPGRARSPGGAARRSRVTKRSRASTT